MHLRALSEQNHNNASTFLGAILNAILGFLVVTYHHVFETHSPLCSLMS